MRCPDCEKMVSYGDPEFETQDSSVDEDGHVSIEVRMALTCGDCGTELKETNFTLETDIEHECEEKLKDEDDKYELVEDDLEVMETEDYRPKYTTNKKGEQKPVPIRYQKHYFGVDVQGNVKCNACGELIPFQMSDDLQASAFDEL